MNQWDVVNGQIRPDQTHPASGVALHAVILGGVDRNLGDQDWVDVAIEPCSPDERMST